MKTPDRIWLLDLGDEITWCDCPDPSGDIHPDDAVAYVKALKIDTLTTENERLKERVEAAERERDDLQAVVDGIWAPADVEKLSMERDELKRERDKLLATFKHTHVAGTECLDTCAKCGLDIRNKIHLSNAVWRKSDD
jgi:hypothetical protein